MHRLGVDVAQNSLLMTVFAEMCMDLPVSMKENEDSFHCCLLAFLLPPLFFFLVSCFFHSVNPWLTISWLQLFVVVFFLISRHFLVAVKLVCWGNKWVLQLC